MEPKETKTRDSIGVLTTIALSAVLNAAAFGQGAAAPSQPQDPTAQAPATLPRGTPPTLPKSETGEGKSAGSLPTADTSHRSRRVRVIQPFMGTVVRRENGYVLRAGDLEYKLNTPSKVSSYVGQRVKVIGTLNKTDNSIQVETINK